jgi:hypothetical protein
VAASDAARPTLASVLDETASELTDDGTRGAELVTTGPFAETLNVTGTTSQGIGTEVTEAYEVSFDLTAFSGPGSTRLSLGTSGLGLPRSSVGSYTEIIRPQGNLTSTLYAFISAGATATYENISIKKVQTVFDGRGDELVTNGGFDDASNWSGQWTISGGVASVDSVAVSNPTLIQNIGAGNKYYEVTLDVVSTNGTGVLEVYHINLGGNAIFDISTTGTKTIRLFGGTHASNGQVSIRARAGFIGSIDNISVKEVLTPNLLLTSAGDDDSTFDTDTGNWTKGTGWTISGGVATGTATTASLDLAFTTKNKKWYKVLYYVSSYTSGTIRFRFSGTANVNGSIVSSAGWHEEIIQATSDNSLLRFSPASAFTGSIDNVIVQEVPASVARAFYLDFDGVDDNMILDGTDFGSSTNATLYKTFRGDATDTQHIMFGTNAGAYILAAQSGGGSASISGLVGSPVYREDGTIPSYAIGNDVFTALIDNTDHTIGVEEADLSANATWTSSGFYIGREYNGSWDNTGRLYAWAAVDTRLDGRNRDLLENYMISKKT